MPAGERFDVFLTGLDSGRRRAEVLGEVRRRFPIEAVEASAFLSGKRVQLQRDVDEATAQAALAQVQSVGGIAERRPHRERSTLADLSEVSGDDLPAGVVATPEAEVNEFLGRGLVSIDGSDEIELGLPESPGLGGLPPPSPLLPSGALFASTPPSAIALEEEAAPHRAPPPPPFIPPAPAPGGDARFRPSGALETPLELALDLPARAAPRASAAPAASEQEEAAAGPRQPAIPRCPKHHIPEVAGRCPACPVEQERVPGRLMEGRLRHIPYLRPALGVVMALGIGYLGSAPYANRVERRISETRRLADRERYRPLEEARVRAAELDAQAESESTSGALGTLAIWMLIGGAVGAGWYRLT